MTIDGRDTDPDAATESPWRIYGLIAGAVALATLNFSLVFVAFGDITETFDASPSTVSWTLTAFSITTAAVFVPAGWMADRFGRSRMFLTGFGVFIVGSGLVAVAPTIELLILARMVQAAGLGIESSQGRQAAGADQPAGHHARMFIAIINGHSAPNLPNWRGYYTR